MTYAIIENNAVVNVIVADESFAGVNFPDAIRIDNFDPVPGIGWRYSMGAFTAPAGSTPIAPSPKTVYSQFEFMALFTLPELAGIYGYQSSTTLTTGQKANMLVFLQFFSVAGSIDVANPITVQGIGYFVTVGLLTSARAAIVLAGS